jgi:hypothetical protein
MNLQPVELDDHSDWVILQNEASEQQSGPPPAEWSSTTAQRTTGNNTSMFASSAEQLTPLESWLSTTERLRIPIYEEFLQRTSPDDTDFRKYSSDASLYPQEHNLSFTQLSLFDYEQEVRPTISNRNIEEFLNGQDPYLDQRFDSPSTFTAGPTSIYQPCLAHFPNHAEALQVWLEDLPLLGSFQ